MSDFKFSERYKVLSNADLLDIIDDASNYQPSAVEAAQFEIDSRKLSTEQLTEAKAEQDLRRIDKENKQQKAEDITNKLKSAGSILAHTFNPIQKEAPSTDKYIKLISLFLGGLFLYNLYSEFGLLKFMFTEKTTQWDFSTALILLPCIVLPVAAILFWIRRKYGWILAAIFFSYTAGGTIVMFVKDFNRRPSGVQALDILFPTTTPAAYIGGLILFGGILWIICKDEIREIYKIDEQTMYLTAIGVGVLTVLLMFMYF